MANSFFHKTARWVRENLMGDSGSGPDQECSPSIPSWPREHYEESGGTPFLFYAVFGEFPEILRVNTSVYRSIGIPKALDARRSRRDEQPELFADFLQGSAKQELENQLPDLVGEVNAAPELIVVKGEPADSGSLDYLRDTVGFVTWLMDNGGICVGDPLMMKWWGPEEWRSDVFNPGTPVPHRHVVILFSDEDEPGTWWYHTRGMRKFGRPDLSLHGVTESEREGVTDLFNRLIGLHAAGGVVPEGMEVRMASLPEGMRCRHRGDTDDPDFNNVHIEIERSVVDEDK